jgi:L-malate glycosyltransferase
MKIGLISNMYPSVKDPRYGIFVKGIADSLTKAGCEIVFLSAIKGRKEGEKAKTFAYLKLYLHALFSIVFRKCDLIYLHYPLHLAPLVYILNSFSVTPLVVNFHGTDLVPATKALQRMERILRKGLASVRMVIVPSEFLKEEVVKKHNVPKERIMVSPSGGVNFDLFKRFDDNPLGKKEYSAGYVSRIEKEKGWHIFIDALRELKDRNKLESKKFLVAGTGSDEKELINTVEKYDLTNNIDIKRVSDQKELPALFNSMEVFVFPSLRESLGLVGIEAMACGTPVIGSSIGGISSYLNDGENGYLFKSGDIKDLADKLELFFSTTKIERMTLVEKASATAERYDRERISGELIKKFKSICSI